MEKLVAELIELLQSLLAIHQRMLEIAQRRQEAMRTFDVAALGVLLERERHELSLASNQDQKRRILVERFRAIMGKGVEPTATQIAARCAEPFKSQILGLSAAVKSVTEQLDRFNRTNQAASQGIARGFSTILRVVTGVAQNAGLYMQNGRKAMLRNRSLLDAVA